MKRGGWRYIVFRCPRCGSVRYSESDKKTAICFKCSYIIKIDPIKTQILFRTNKKTEAIEAAKKYKMRSWRSADNKLGNLTI